MSDFYPRSPEAVASRQAEALGPLVLLNEAMAWGIMLQWFREFWAWWMGRMRE